ncbi:hypothetical protein L596_010296 [Steinernema carpocapsae]|uniref:Peptide-N(4)-(N-acetyl-beta-glucosaminyl)asparagine amidase n=1 Tax=Steinernema carpocapsae TaxID=34508 RepID=A0A4U5PHW7_STECR|nr:hypothetical protein L596_010296 [Steinernema carpocapsae]
MRFHLSSRAFQTLFRSFFLTIHRDYILQTYQNVICFQANTMPVFDVLSDQDFTHLNYSTGNHALICQFSALWCEPCRRISPVFDELQKQYKDIVFARINFDVCPETVRRFNVTSVPTFVFILNSQEVARFSGSNPQELAQRCNELNERMPRTQKRRDPKAASHTERQFLSEFVRYADRMFDYENEVSQMQALSLIPEQELKESATEDGVLDEVKLAQGMAHWFKGSFFTWVDKPKCPTCLTDETVVEGGSVEPSSGEAADGANKVELYICGACSGHVRFPRYNNPVKLLETRKGRCGEWANCFALFCFAMGLETRFVVDRADHVWVEIWATKLDRWVHCDPCEAVVDTPLLYEKGWGKKLSYVVAFGIDNIRDVTWRYTFDHKAAIKRRRSVREEVLARFIHKLQNRQSTRAKPRAKRQDELSRRRIREAVEMLTPKLQLRGTGEEGQGRVSGSAAWTRQRGEDGGVKPGFAPFEIRPTEDDVTNKMFTLTYSVTADSYANDNSQGSSKGFASQAFKVDGVFRKVEIDWKVAYLCREEGRESGEIAWRIDLKGLPVADVEIDLSGMTTFENGRIQAIACCGDFCVRIPTETGRAVLQDVGNVDHVDISVTFEAGSGKLAWQHAQLFRKKLDEASPDMKVQVRFK